MATEEEKLPFSWYTWFDAWPKYVELRFLKGHQSSN